MRKSKVSRLLTEFKVNNTTARDLCQKCGCESVVRQTVLHVKANEPAVMSTNSSFFRYSAKSKCLQPRIVCTTNMTPRLMLY